MLTEAGIELGLDTVDTAAVEADSAGTREEEVRAAPRSVKLQIDWGCELLGV